MNRLFAVSALISTLVVSGCAAQTGEEEGSDDAAGTGGHAAASSTAAPSAVEAPSPGGEHVGESSDALTSSDLYSYGGGFQVDDCNRNNVNNPTTGSLSCPSGTQAQWTGRSLGPESRCGSNQFTCLAKPYTSGHFTFGGFFQVDDCGTDDVGNPNYNNWMACPTGFGAYGVARVTAPESGCGAWQYACIGTSSAWAYPAGTFQIDDCATDNVADFASHGLYCPSGYVAHKYGRIKAPEGSQCGATQYVCTNW